MENDIMDIEDIENISANLTMENKKYVIAVANALLFSQNGIKQPDKPPKNKPA